jgi:hypothetical protein
LGWHLDELTAALEFFLAAAGVFRCGQVQKHVPADGIVVSSVTRYDSAKFRHLGHYFRKMAKN